MLPSIRSLLTLMCAGTLACGGAIQREESSESSGSTATTFSAPGISATSTPPYGVWDLTALDASTGSGSTQTFGYLFLDLRPDGTAIARRCTEPRLDGNRTLRCASTKAYECLYGSVGWDGEVYRVDVPDLRAAPNQPRGEVVATEDKLVIRDILPAYRSGRFAPVTGDSPTLACGDR